MNDTIKIERPAVAGNAPMEWVSDVAAEMMRRIGIKYIVQNPGASFGGLHDSIVNYLGNDDPTMLLCLNENQAVAIGQGYAKVTGEPLAVIVHSNVGLMSGSMAIFNAWCDRAPVFIVGATGPGDAAQRTPWIHWIHTAKDQGALIRNFTKWDDEPRSPKALIEAMLRANIIARTPPMGPVYICLDVALQETALAGTVELPDMSRFQPPQSPEPPAAVIAEAAELLLGARSPLIMAGRVSRSGADWDRRVRLAEALGAAVVTDIKNAAAFPTDHPLHVGAPGVHFRGAQRDALEASDVVLGLDWVDFGSVLGATFAGGPVKPRVIHCSVDSYVHNGWSMDYYGLPPADVRIQTVPDEAVRCLLAVVEERLMGAAPRWDGAAKSDAKPDHGTIKDRAADAPVTPLEIVLALDHARQWHDICMARTPLGWVADAYAFRAPLDYLGKDGGGGVGSGPGTAIGAALALMGTGRIAVSVIGDGDFMQGSAALWTAAHYRIPALIIVCNNRSHFNDEVIQGRIAGQRGRPKENAWVGQRIEDPAVDLAAIARAQGVAAEGPLSTVGDFLAALERAFKVVEGGAPCFLDVVVQQTESASSFSQSAGQKPAGSK